MFHIQKPLPRPSPYHPSGSSQCTSPKHPVPCIKLALVTITRFIQEIFSEQEQDTLGELEREADLDSCAHPHGAQSLTKRKNKYA